MTNFFGAVAVFFVLLTGASLADCWFMRRVEVSVLYADTAEVRKLLLEMVPGVGLGIDPVRNLLLVHGTEEQIEVVQTLLDPGERTDSTLDITAIQTFRLVDAGTASWQRGIVKEYVGAEQVREYECSKVLWVKTTRMNEG